MEIEHEIISRAILLPFSDSRRAVVSYKQKYVHEVLVNHLVKFIQKKKVWLGDLIGSQDMAIAVDWDVKHQTKQKQIRFLKCYNFQISLLVKAYVLIACSPFYVIIERINNTFFCVFQENLCS